MLVCKESPSFFSEVLFSFCLLSLLSFLHCFSVYCTETYDCTLIQGGGRQKMKIRLLINDEHYDAIASELIKMGIEIDDNAELVLSKNNVCLSLSLSFVAMRRETSSKRKISYI